MASAPASVLQANSEHLVMMVVILNIWVTIYRNLSENGKKNVSLVKVRKHFPFHG